MSARQFSVGEFVRLAPSAAGAFPRRIFGRRGIIVDIAFGPDMLLVRWRGYPLAMHMQAGDLEEAGQ